MSTIDPIYPGVVGEFGGAPIQVVGGPSGAEEGGGTTVWTPKYRAKFTKPVVRQLIAIIQRDQRAALDYVDPRLASIVSYQIAAASIKQCPALLVAPMETLFQPDAVGSLESANRFYIAIALAHQDVEVLTEGIQDFVVALDAILNTVPISDFYTSLPCSLRALPSFNTVPLEDGSLKDLFVAAHRYDQIRQLGANGFQMSATIEVHVHREET